MKIRHGLCVALILILSSASAIGNDNVTSAELTKCLDKSGGVTADMLDCDGAEMERQDKRLNAAYQKLMRNASDEQKKALKDAQRLWLSYRKTNCALTYTFGGGGTLDSISASSCEVEILARRVKFLEGLAPE